MLKSKLGKADIGLFTFLASAHPADTCGTDGLPVTPNSIKIVGRFQELKLLEHPRLCQYVDIIRGKHERLVVVSEFYGHSIQDHFDNVDNEVMQLSELQTLTYDVMTALEFLHRHGYVHRNLSPTNVLLDLNKRIKLSKYGLYYVTSYNADVRFPITDVKYMAPEVLFSGVEYNPLYGPSVASVDVWSLGMFVLDCFLHGQLWGKLRGFPGKITLFLFELASLKDNVNVLDRIINVSNCRSRYDEIDKSLKYFLIQCLTIDPSARPTIIDLFSHDLVRSLHDPMSLISMRHPFPAVYRSGDLKLPDFKKLIKESLNSDEEEDHLASRPIFEVYHLWNLVGGDVFSVLKRHGVVNSKAPSLMLPLAILNNGEEFGISEDESLTCDLTTVPVNLYTLRNRLEHIDSVAYYPLVVTEDLFKIDLSATEELPLVIREKDVEYQFHRIILFERLLDGYPSTRNRIIKEARVDIPPFVRARVWAALLNITGDVVNRYERMDKVRVTPTDRQIEVDIPRCHQYNNLLSSPTGHDKLKSVLKAWVISHPQLVYWQGLDSLAAPFVFLNFNNEALAYSCLSAFIPKYLFNFFLKDNSAIIQEYLAVFKQLIAFHDPDLYNHLEEIEFQPELYAIPWFLTMFSHVFPLQKIFYLWDTLLLGTSMLPLCIGVAILQQFREQLLSYGFNDCILLFSDMPTIDIEKCVKESIKLFNHTPPSACFRKEDNLENRVRAPAEEQFMNLPEKNFLTLTQLRSEVCVRISPRDLVRISQLIHQSDSSPQLSHVTAPTATKNIKKRTKKERKISVEPQNKLLVIDVRNLDDFRAGHLPNSVNVPFSQAVSEAYTWISCSATKVVEVHKGKMIMVMGSKGPEPVQMANLLVSQGYRRVCVMDGSLSILRNLGYLNATR